MACQMNREELQVVMTRGYTPFVYSNAPGITALLYRDRNSIPEIVDVPVGIHGVVESVDESNVTIRWDHYYFENHVLQECFLNPIGILSLDNLHLLRTNKYPPNVRLT